MGDFWAGERSLGNAIVADLKAGILARYPERVEPPVQDELSREIDRHEDFIRTATDVFIEREGDFAALDAYAGGDSQNLFVLVARAGLGKSTLLANWVARWRSRKDRPEGETLHVRFVGVGERSNSVDSLLRSILEELRRSGKSASEIPDNANLLRSKFAELLGEAGKQGRVVVVIDALNQLQSGLSDLDWVARTLPENVKLIVSFKLGDEASDALAAQLRTDNRVTVAEVAPFTSIGHREALVAAYLRQYLKELDQQHLHALVRAEGAENPLFLKVVLTELRVFGAFAQLGEVIQHEFGNTPQSAFDAVLRRLESDSSHGTVPANQTVPLLFGLLAHARGGLPEELLVAMLLAEPGFDRYGADAVRSTIRLLLRQMRPFLARRDGRVDFFYEAFQIGAASRYTSDDGQGRPAQSDHPTLGTERLQQLEGRWNGHWEHVAAAVSEPPCAIEPAVHRHVRADAAHRWKKSQWHARLALACAGWAQWGLPAKRYALGNFVHHSIEAADVTAAAAAMTDFTYQHARLQHLGTSNLVEIAKDFAAVGRSTLLWEKRLEVEVWKQFYDQHTHWLRGPDNRPEVELLQRSYAHADQSPVTQSAERWLKERGSSTWWFRRVGRPKHLMPSACLRTLDGQTSAFAQIALHADGQRMVAGMRDGAVLIWDLETGTCLKRLEGHTDEIDAVALHTDGRRALTTSRDKVTRVWDLETGTCLLQLQGHPSSFLCRRNAWEAMEIQTDGTVQVWSLETGASRKSQLERERNGSHVSRIVPTRDWQWVAMWGDNDTRLNIWNLKTGALTLTLRVSEYSKYKSAYPVSAVAFHPDEERLVTGCRDGESRVWSLEYGVELVELKNWFDREEIVSVAFHADGARVMLRMNERMEIRELKTGNLLRELGKMPARINTQAMHPDGRRIVVGMDDGTVQVWDIEAGECLRSFKGTGDGVRSVEIHVDGRQAVTRSANGTVQVWNMEGGTSPIDPSHSLSRISAVTLHPHGQQAVTKDEYRRLKVWDLPSGTCQRALQGRNVGLLVRHPDALRIVTGGLDALEVWELNTGTLVTTLRLPVNDLFLLGLLHLDERRAITGNADGSAWVWNLETGACLRKLEGHTDGLMDVALHPDGQRAITASKDTTVRIWDIETGQCLQILEGHTAEVCTAVLHPDRKRAVTGSYDGTARVWDIDTGACLRTLCGPSDLVNAVVLARDGCRVILGSRGSKFWVCDIDTGECLRTLPCHGSGVVASDGRRLQTRAGHPHNTDEVWDLETGACMLALCDQDPNAPAPALHPDQYHLVIAKGETLRLLDLGTGACLGTWQGTNPVSALALNRFAEEDNARLVIGRNDGSVDIFELVPPSYAR